MGCEFIDKLVKYASAAEVLVYKKQVSSTIQELLAFQPDNNVGSGTDLEFVSNYQVRDGLYPACRCTFTPVSILVCLIERCWGVSYR